MLIFDSEKDHIDDGVKKASSSPKFGAKLSVISGGLTKILQSLDISGNR